MSFNNTGKVWTVEGFKEYLSTQPKNKWAKAVCLHHTAAPSLKQRPEGFKAQHLENLKSYYSNSLGWSSAPHFFTDEDQVWGMCPIAEFGVHAVTFNRTAIGIEVLGDYDSEDPKSGRGLLCWETAAKTTKLLLDYLGLEANDLSEYIKAASLIVAHNGIAFDFHLLKKLWGVLGNQQTYFSPQKQVEGKITRTFR